MATKLGEFSTTALADRVPGARHRVTNIAAANGAEQPALGNIELLASEILTNAVVHTKTKRIDVVVSMGDRRVLRVEVTDDGSGGPVKVPNEDPLSESGRGLRLLQAFADAWGVECDDTARTVWFEVTF